ncbi:MAG: 50S ribosomal protein L15 [Spirochaetia bacterium]
MSSLEIKVPFGATRQRKRVGRGQGSGFGTTSGRGTKGQKSRTGGSAGPYPGFEGGQVPLYRRLATRGFSNARYALNYIGVNLVALDRVFSDGDEVTWESLVSKGLINKSEKMVKILGGGEIKKKLKVSASLKISESAKEKIEKAGGKVQ